MDESKWLRDESLYNRQVAINCAEIHLGMGWKAFLKGNETEGMKNLLYSVETLIKALRTLD